MTNSNIQTPIKIIHRPIRISQASTTIIFSDEKPQIETKKVKWEGSERDLDKNLRVWEQRCKKQEEYPTQIIYRGRKEINAGVSVLFRNSDTYAQVEIRPNQMGVSLHSIPFPAQGIITTYPINRIRLIDSSQMNMSVCLTTHSELKSKIRQLHQLKQFLRLLACLATEDECIV